MRREARARTLNVEPSMVVFMVGVGECNVSLSQILNSLSTERGGRAKGKTSGSLDRRLTTGGQVAGSNEHVPLRPFTQRQRLTNRVLQ